MGNFFDELEQESDLSAEPRQVGGFFDDIERDQSNELSTRMEYAKRKSPEVAAKHYDTADQTGLPVEYVERNEDAATAQDFDYDGLRKKAPLLANMLRDQRNADLAQKELDNLSWFEEVARETVNVAKIVPAASYTAGESGYATLSATQSILELVPKAPTAATAKAQELLGFEDAAKRSWQYYEDLGMVSRKLQEIAAGQGAARAELIPKPSETRFHPAVWGGIESALINLSAIGTSVLTRNPKSALSIMGTITFGKSYSEGKQKGLGDFDAFVYGTNNTIAELVPERVPLVALLSDIDKNTGFTKMLAKQMFSEIITEQITTVWQDAVKWGTLNPDKTLDQFMDERGDAAYNTLISTIVATGLQTSVVAGIQKIGGQQEADVIAGIVERANESNYRELDKVNFETYLQEVSEEYGSVENIYIEHEAARAALDQMEEDDNAKQIIMAQIEEAESLNGDIVVPVGEFASSIAVSPNYQFLKDSVRISPDADVVTINAFDRIQEANASIDRRDESKRIFNEVVDQLKATGKLTPEQSRLSAEIIPAFLGANPERMGLTVEEAYEMMGLKIVGPQEEIMAPDERAEFAGVIDALKAGEDTQETQELSALIESQGIDITQDTQQVINSLSKIKEFTQPSVREEVIKSDPLTESQEWRDQTVTATLDDGSKQEINAGAAYDIITERKEAAQSILDCINANP